MVYLSSNQKVKEEKVIIPSIQLSVILKNDKKLSNQECLDLLQEVVEINKKVFGEKFQRLGVEELQGSLSQSKTIYGVKDRKSVTTQDSKTVHTVPWVEDC